MLGTKSVVNARGAALDAARYYGLRFASSSERRVYSASRRLHPSPSLNSQSIRGRAPSPRRAAVNTPQYTAARHALLLGKFSARTRKRRASFPEAKETKKKRNAAPRRRLRRRSLRRAVSGSALPGRVPGTRLLARRHQPLPRHLGPSSRISPRSAPDRARQSRRRRAPPASPPRGSRRLRGASRSPRAPVCTGTPKRS